MNKIISFAFALVLCITALNANWMDKGWQFQETLPTKIKTLLILNPSVIPEIPREIKNQAQRVIFDYEVPDADFSELKTLFPNLESIYLNKNATIPSSVFKKGGVAGLKK